MVNYNWERAPLKGVEFHKRELSEFPPNILTKFQLETFESRLAETEEKWKTTENNLNECKASWEEQKRLHAEELGKLVSRCEELTDQNTLLHQQGEKVGSFL